MVRELRLPTDNSLQAYRNDVTPQSTVTDLPLAQRLRSWIEREVVIFVKGGIFQASSKAVPTVIDLLARLDPRSEEFIEQIRPFFYVNAFQFSHELSSFLRAPPAVIAAGYDACAAYDRGIVFDDISSDETDDEADEIEYVETANNYSASDSETDVDDTNVDESGTSSRSSSSDDEATSEDQPSNKRRRLN